MVSKEVPALPDANNSNFKLFKLLAYPIITF